MPRQPLRVMGTAEIAEYLGVSRQWVEVLSKRRDFPEPAAILKAGRIWRSEEIEHWAAKHRPRPEPDKARVDGEGGTPGQHPSSGDRQ